VLSVSQRLTRADSDVKELKMVLARARCGQRGFKNDRVRLAAACWNQNGSNHEKLFSA
jgi:hypothetical protein